MLTTAPKDIRENVARALGYLRKDELERSLLVMCEALRRMAEVKMLRTARAELDNQVNDFLSTLVHHPCMQPLLDPARTGNPKNIPFQQGKEAALATVMDGLAKILQKESENCVQAEATARRARKKHLIDTGLQFIREGQTAKGRAFLKRVIEEFRQEDGIRVQVAQIFAAAGLHQEAAETYEEAIAKQQRDPAAYTGAVASWMELLEYEKAEAVYRAVLRTFGGHPSTYGKMAKLYLVWHKRQKAEEMALRALHDDPEQADALEVMDALERR